MQGKSEDEDGERDMDEASTVSGEAEVHSDLNPLAEVFTPSNSGERYESSRNEQEEEDIGHLKGKAAEALLMKQNADPRGLDSLKGC